MVRLYPRESWQHLEQIEEVLEECKCSINSKSVKQRPRAVSDTACCVAELGSKWELTHLAQRLVWQPTCLLLSWLMFSQSVCLHRSHWNFICSVSTWNCDTAETWRYLSCAIAKEEALICVLPLWCNLLKWSYSRSNCLSFYHFKKKKFLCKTKKLNCVSFQGLLFQSDSFPVFLLMYWQKQKQVSFNCLFVNLGNM